MSISAVVQYSQFPPPSEKFSVNICWILSKLLVFLEIYACFTYSDDLLYFFFRNVVFHPLCFQKNVSIIRTTVSRQLTRPYNHLIGTSFTNCLQLHSRHIVCNHVRCTFHILNLKIHITKEHQPSC